VPKRPFNGLEVNIILRFLSLFNLNSHHYDLTKKLIKSPDSSKHVEYQLKAEYLNKKMKAKAKRAGRGRAAAREEPDQAPQRGAAKDR